MYPKFIITLDGEIKFGNVFLHRELLPKGHTICYGGGLWKIDNQRGCLLLYGRSFDFGLPDFEQARYVNRTEMPGALNYPMYYMRKWVDEEILEPIELQP